MNEVFPLSLLWLSGYPDSVVLLLLFLKNTVFCAQADMLDQEAAFVQIQEAKTMVEEDLQRRLEEFEDEKEQLQKVAASAASLEQRLEQASAHRASRGCPGAAHSPSLASLPALGPVPAESVTTSPQQSGCCCHTWPGVDSILVFHPRTFHTEH